MTVGMLIAAALCGGLLTTSIQRMMEEVCPVRIVGYDCNGEKCDHSYLALLQSKVAKEKRNIQYRKNLEKSDYPKGN